MYNDDGLYQTHSDGLAFKDKNFVPKGFYSVDPTNCKPNLRDFNHKDHYYVPEVTVKKEKGIPVLLSQEEFEKARPKDAVLIELINSEWPSTFINFHFPVRDFDKSRLTVDGFIGIFIPRIGVFTDHHTLYLQEQFDINLVDNFGQAHIIGGVYCESGVLITKCFGCGNKADDCMCSLWRKQIPVISEVIEFLSNPGLQICYNVPKISGISCQSEYGILFLDKNKKKHETDLQISGILCQGSSKYETTQSGEISDISSLQELSETSKYATTQLSTNSNGVTSFRGDTSSSGGWQTSGGLSSGLGLGQSSNFCDYDEEKGNCNESNETTSQRSRSGAKGNGALIRTQGPKHHVKEEWATTAQEQTKKESGSTGYRTHLVNANCYRAEERQQQDPRKSKSKTTKTERKQRFVKWREQRKLQKIQLFQWATETEKQEQEQKKKRRRQYQREWNRKHRIKRDEWVNQQLCAVSDCTYPYSNTNGPG